MAIGRETTATLIKPLRGAVIRRYQPGATIAAGELVSMQSDGFVDPSDSTSAADGVVGVAVTAGTSTGPKIDVVVFGPVLCLTGATVGAAVYNSTTAGEPSESSAGNNTLAGWAETATILFVNPTPA